MQVISDIADPRINFYKDLRYTPKSHKENRLFISEGKNTVKVLLETNLKIKSILLDEHSFRDFGSLLSTRIPENNIYFADKELMNKIVGFKLHQGIMALSEIPKEVHPREMQSLIVVLNGIINSENVGAIIRNCIAFGVKNIIFDKATSHPFLRRSVRVSMGSVCHINHFESVKLIDDLKDLKEKGYTAVAIENMAAAESIDKFKFAKRSVLVFGSEGNGVESDIMDICTNVVKIPMSRQIGSINVAASSAIILSKLFSKNN